ncbi:MAG TPA: hypothetical protein VIP79_02455 [Gemmatimonadaceae bacterium]
MTSAKKPVRLLALLRRRAKPSAASANPGRRVAIGLTVGIGISAESVRAVGASGGAVRWAIELERSDGEALGDTLSALIERCPLARWPRARATVAVGPSAVQVKRLTALPALTDSAALEAIIREGAGRFFLRNGVPLLTSGVRVEEPGTAWAAAFEAPVVEEVERACRSAGRRLKLLAMVPTAVALAHAVDGKQGSAPIVWADGEVRMALTFSAGTIASIRRLPRHGGELDGHSGSEVQSPPAALGRLGERALDFADAYGATRVLRDEPLRVRLGGAASSSATAPTGMRGRLAFATTVFALSGLVALIGPGLVALHAARQSSARLGAIEKEVRRAERAERELGRVSGALGGVTEFEASRRSATMLLSDITHALPKEASLVAFQADTAGGTLVALSQRAALVTNALEKVKGIASPEIVGPVTRETAGSREVERVTVRFRLAR